jgi:hypothetical protein
MPPMPRASEDIGVSGWHTPEVSDQGRDLGG